MSEIIIVFFSEGIFGRCSEKTFGRVSEGIPEVTYKAFPEGNIRMNPCKILKKMSIKFPLVFS